MLECPFCHEQVKHQGRDNWFDCPACQNWIRLRVNQNGSKWLEAGYYANEDIHPLQFGRQPGQPPRASNRASRPNIQDMDLESVQAQRQRAAAKLHDLEQAVRDFQSQADFDFVDPRALSALIDSLQGSLCTVLHRAKFHPDEPISILAPNVTGLDGGKPRDMLHAVPQTGLVRCASQYFTSAAGCPE